MESLARHRASDKKNHPEVFVHRQSSLFSKHLIRCFREKAISRREYRSHLKCEIFGKRKENVFFVPSVRENLWEEREIYLAPRIVFLMSTKSFIHGEEKKRIRRRNFCEKEKKMFVLEQRGKDVLVTSYSEGIDKDRRGDMAEQRRYFHQGYVLFLHRVKTVA